MTTNATMAHLDAIHWVIIDELRVADRTPSVLRDHTPEAASLAATGKSDVSRQTIANRINDLLRLGIVERPYYGVYHLAHDPADDDPLATPRALDFDLDNATEPGEPARLSLRATRQGAAQQAPGGGVTYEATLTDLVDLRLAVQDAIDTLLVLNERDYDAV